MSTKAINLFCFNLANLQFSSSHKPSSITDPFQITSDYCFSQDFQQTEKSQHLASISLQTPGLLNSYPKELLGLYTHNSRPIYLYENIFNRNAASWSLSQKNSLQFFLKANTIPSEKVKTQRGQEGEEDKKQNKNDLLQKIMFLNRIYNLEIMSLVNNPKTLEKVSYEVEERDSEAQRLSKLQKKNYELMRKNALMRDILNEIKNKVLETNIVYSHFQYNILDEEICLQHPATFSGKLPSEFYETYKKERGFTIEDLKTFSEEEYEIPTVWKGPLLIVADMEAKYNMIERRYLKIIQKNKDYKSTQEILLRENQDLWERMRCMDVKAFQRKRQYEDNLEQLMNNYELKIKNILEMVREGTMNSDINLLKDEITRAGQLVQQKNICIQRLTERINNLQATSKEISTENSELREFIDSRYAIDYTTSENDEQQDVVTGQIEKYQTKIKYFQKYTSYLEDENSKLKKLSSELEETKITVNKLSQQISLMEEQNKNLLKEIDSLQNLNQRFQLEIQQIKGKQINSSYNSYVEEKNKKVGMSIEVRENDELKMSEEVLREEYKETVKKNQVLERNLSDLHFEFEKLRGCIQKFKEERFNLVTNNRELRTMLKQYQIKQSKNRQCIPVQRNY